MRQDRRLNGWVLIGSIIQMILGIILISVGIALGVVGFLYTNKLATIKDLQFFVNQPFFTQFNLKPEFLYLFLGIAVGVVGVIVLSFAIVSLSYAKRRRVVRHRVALPIFSLIPLSIAGCAGAYFALEFKSLPNNIKYILYGIIGAFGFVALCYILGVMFGRSEKFMSNDNNKYAFDNSTLRNARADINHRPVQAQGVSNNMARPVQQGAGQRPVQRPLGQATARPVQPMARTAQQPRPIQPASRPNMPQRPMPTSVQTRPISSGAQKPIYCNKCGKMLSPEEKFCTLCGYKIK